MQQVNFILLVDDDPDDMDFIKIALERVVPQARVITAWHGEEALQILSAIGEGTLPDVIFLDHNMPRIDGPRCLVALQESARWRHIPVIFTSTSSSQADKINMLALGAKKYWVKSSTWRALFQDVADLLEVPWTPGPEDRV